MAAKSQGVKFAGLLSTVSALLLSGCVFSLHPFYTEESATYAPALIGTWVDDLPDPEQKATDLPGSRGRWEFSPDGKGYKLAITERNGRRGEFRARLFTVDGEKYIDLFPAKSDSAEQSEYYRDHLLAIHSVIHVAQIEPTLLLRIPDPNWFEKFIVDNPNAVPHARVEDSWIINDKWRPQDRVILTGSPAELQAYLRRIVRTDDAWKEIDPLRRRASAQ